MSVGYSPLNTTGRAGLNPGTGRSVGLATEVIVSPIWVSPMSLIPPVSQPTSPADSVSLTVGSGLKKPTLSTSNPFPVETILTRSPDLTVPSSTRMNVTTPW